MANILKQIKIGNTTYDIEPVTAYLPLTGGTLSGNLNAKYITGTWLQTTAATDLGSTPSNYCVISDAGWLYKRTLAETKSDLNVPALAGNGSANTAAKSDHTHTSLKSNTDNRNANTTPNDYNGVLNIAGLKDNSKIGLDTNTYGTYSCLLGVRGWQDSSGGDSHEIALTGNGQLMHRYGSTTSWGSWNRIAHVSDIPTNYVTTDTAQTITGYKTISSIGIDTINGATLGNAILRQNASSGEVIIGSTVRPLRLWGNQTRPTYSKDDGVSYKNLALLSDLNGYLSLSGGTLTGTLGFKSNYLIKPVAEFRTQDSTFTGAITIALPAGISNTMVSMWIDVYNYSTNTSFSVHVGGYTYENNTWQHNPFAMVYGANHTVRLGHNGTNFVIYIGETNSTWSYPQISVRNVILGFRPDYDNWKKDWGISFVTSFSNVSATINNYAWTTKNFTPPTSLPANGGDADTVDGDHSSAFARVGAHNNLTASGNEFTFASNGYSGPIYLNWRTAGGTNGNITEYILGNGAGGQLGSIIHSGNIGSQNVNYANSAGSVVWGNVTDKPSTFPPIGHGHSTATQSGDGFMSSTDKKKLDGIAEGANRITVDSLLKSNSNNPVRSSTIYSAFSSAVDFESDKYTYGNNGSWRLRQYHATGNSLDIRYGNYSIDAQEKTYSVSFSKPMGGSNYAIVCGIYRDNRNSWFWSPLVKKKTESGFDVYVRGNTSGDNSGTLFYIAIKSN